MTSIFAEAQVETEHGRHHLAELCRTLEQRAAAAPERVMEIDWTETHGTIDFGWGCCSILAARTSLTLRAEAGDASALHQVCELITRHLERSPGGERLTITWQRDGKRFATDDRDRRDAMRAFHRRMRDHKR